MARNDRDEHGRVAAPFQGNLEEMSHQATKACGRARPLTQAGGGLPDAHRHWGVGRLWC